MAASFEPSPQYRARVPFFVPIFNPVARRLMGAGLTLGPNALLTVRGRKTGMPRTTPVALVEVEGRRWVIGTFGEVNWVQNLRAAGKASLRIGRREQEVRAAELAPAERASFFRDTLGPYVRRIPFGTFLIGSLLGAGEILDDPKGAGQRHPVFELFPA